MHILKHINNGNSRLLLFFSGWSASPFLFINKMEADKDTDLWIVYDYRDMSFAEDLSPYQEVRLIAWSMGVWAADCLADNSLSGINIPGAIAINGTPCPINDTLGIPEAIFRGTLDNLTGEGLRRFNRRMCGSRELLSAYEQSAPLRPLDEVREELQSIYDTIRCIHIACGTKTDAGNFNNSGRLWTHAIISTDDHIFPAVNQHTYWDGRCPVTTVPAPHYPFHLWKQWSKIWKL